MIDLETAESDPIRGRIFSPSFLFYRHMMPGASVTKFFGDKRLSRRGLFYFSSCETLQIFSKYAAFIEEITGANSQGETLEEAKENFVEALKIVLETNKIHA
jgi:hypothetical protein